MPECRCEYEAVTHTIRNKVVDMMDLMLNTNTSGGVLFDNFYLTSTVGE